jgi:asparagine synthase
MAHALTHIMKPYFDACIHSVDLDAGSSWQVTNADDRFGIYKGRSYLSIQQRTAYPSTFLIQDSHMLLLGYADARTLEFIKKLGKDVTHARLLSDLSREFLVVMLDTQKGQVRIMRDATCTLPIFASMDSERLEATNEYTVLMGHLPTLTVSPKIALNQLLALEPSKEKIIKNTFYLGQVEELCYSTETRTITEAPLTEFACIPELNDEAPRMFKRILEEMLDEFWQTRLAGQNVGFELSGGFDSSLVAGYFALRNKPSIQTFTKGFYGKDALSQAKKIQAFTKRFNVTNHTMYLELPEHLPLSGFCKPEGPLDSFDDKNMYQEAAEDFVKMMADNGVEVAVNGIGGDEFCTIYKPEDRPTYIGAQDVYERRTAMPTLISDKAREKYLEKLRALLERRRPYVPASVNAAFMYMSNTYIRKGIWPVTPYANPKYLYFMRHLPPKYLYERRIIKAYLAARDFPPEIYNRTYNESFASLFMQCLHADWLPMWSKCLEDSVLIEKGFVSRQDAEYNYRQAQTDMDYYGTWVYKFMELEKFLRQKRVTLEHI